MLISEFPSEKKEMILEKANYIKNNNIVLDAKKIAKDYGITVHYVPEIHPYAFTTRNEVLQRPEIYIISNATEDSKEILLWHEMGHFFCESRCETHLFSNRINHESEFIANCFMLQFLPHVLDGQEIKDTTNIKAVNHYITAQIHLQSKNHPYMKGQISLLNLIDINDSFWNYGDEVLIAN